MQFVVVFAKGAAGSVGHRRHGGGTVSQPDRDPPVDERLLLQEQRTDGAARATYPSRWLLEQVARIEGVPAVYASDMAQLFGPQRSWLDRIASAYEIATRHRMSPGVALQDPKRSRGRQFEFC